MTLCINIYLTNMRNLYLYLGTARAAHRTETVVPFVPSETSTQRDRVQPSRWSAM